MIKSKADQLKNEITLHLNQSSNQVDVFSSSLMAKKDQLDDLWTSTQHLITQVSHSLHYIAVLNRT